MRFLYKKDTRTDAQYVAIPANSESMDFYLCRRLRLVTDTIEDLTSQVRLVFCLGHHDEVELSYMGEWNSEVILGKIRHPFLDDTVVEASH
jgi:hypothetical protein